MASDWGTMQPKENRITTHTLLTAMYCLPHWEKHADKAGAGHFGHNTSAPVPKCLVTEVFGYRQRTKTGIHLRENQQYRVQTSGLRTVKLF